jgi:hypothetical protein
MAIYGKVDDGATQAGSHPVPMHAPDGISRPSRRVVVKVRRAPGSEFVA